MYFLVGDSSDGMMMVMFFSAALCCTILADSDMRYPMLKGAMFSENVPTPQSEDV